MLYTFKGFLKLFLDSEHKNRNSLNVRIKLKTFLMDNNFVYGGLKL